MSKFQANQYLEIFLCLLWDEYPIPSRAYQMVDAPNMRKFKFWVVDIIIVTLLLLLLLLWLLLASILFMVAYHLNLLPIISHQHSNIGVSMQISSLPCS